MATTGKFREPTTAGEQEADSRWAASPDADIRGGIIPRTTRGAGQVGRSNFKMGDWDMEW